MTVRAGLRSIPHAAEVVLAGRLRDGCTAHRASTYTWTVDGVEHTVPMGACQKIGGGPAKAWRPVSGGWAVSRGAVPCPNPKCFGEVA